jgi:hypothetical protein
MKYENGILILDDSEAQFLSMVAMKKADREYPATEFIGSLVEMKGEAEKYILETESKQDPDKNDSLRIEVTCLIIEMFDVLTQKGYEAAETAGHSIRWQ